MSNSAVVYIILGLLIVQRLLELRHARRNEQWAREHGAVEFGADHYWMFFVLHSSWFVAIVAECIIRGIGFNSYWLPIGVLLVLTQALRYWAIRSLGRYWNTRVLIIPTADLVRGGPYRYVKHPNYIAVVLEIALVPMLFNAWFTAAVFTIANAIVLLYVRIPVEEAALKTLGGSNEKAP